MRALVYADLQATDGHERCFTDPTKPLQIYRIERLFGELRRIYEQYECDALWDLGDTTDDRSAVPVPVIDTVCDHLETFDGEGNIMLVGNHQQFVRDTKVHAGKMFRRYFRVIDTFANIKVENVNVLCVSYHDNLDAIVEFLSRPLKQDATVLLLGHFQLAGCQTASGTALTGVPRSSLENVNIALLGHIHKPQTIGKHIHYVGSPFQQHWGEAGENKRVAVVDIEGNEIRLTWVPLEGFPRYRQVSFADFLKFVREDSEDRYKVILSSIAETEQYYAHPLANRADEVIYDYDQAIVTANGTETAEVLPRTRTDTLRRYLTLHPPKDLGISLDEDTMLSYGDDLLLRP